jgi:hypothetical protein
VANNPEANPKVNLRCICNPFKTQVIVKIY